MERSKLNQLLEKYRKETCTAEERALVESWYNSLAQNRQDEGMDEDLLELKENIWDEVKIRSGLDGNNVVKAASIWRNLVAVAAVLIFIIGGALFFIKQHQENSNLIARNRAKYQIVPGSNKAILTLANGNKINLTDAGNGKLAEQAGIKVSKAADGKLIYTVTENSNTNSVAGNEYNAIETPRGGQYQVNLPDGTKVWLNAASSLRYPARFKANERRVELTGEAYFEVAHNKESPFIVSSQKQEIKVLGTHFNINAYADEATVNTTLLEGSVQVTLTDTHLSCLLKPGQQAQVNQRIKVVNSNGQEAVAWKNGMIKFTNQNIRYVMRMISRWYDVDVVYDGHVSDVGFGGSVSRSMNISEILKILETTGYVHFKVEGRSVIVMP